MRILLGCLSLCLSVQVTATSTGYHLLSGHAQLAKGEPTSTVLTSEGVVTLGPELKQLADSLGAQVLDVVAGMTDRYALRIHDQVFRPARTV